jgi:26S proteasome regulatory subunit N6
MAPVDSDRIIQAQEAAKADSRRGETLYQDILSKTPSATNDAAVREYETALVKLGELYRDEKYLNSYHLWGPRLTGYNRKVNELVNLITTSRTALSSFAKAKTAKLGKPWTPSIPSCPQESHTDISIP